MVSTFWTNCARWILRPRGRDFGRHPDDVAASGDRRRRLRLSQQTGESRRYRRRRPACDGGRSLMELTPCSRTPSSSCSTSGSAARAPPLSELTGHRVILDVPKVRSTRLTPRRGTRRRACEDVASVHQIFSGPVAGDALLILNYSAAAMLKQLLTDEPPLPLALDGPAREVLTEVGNILLNACLGSSAICCRCRSRFPCRASTSTP